jgi:putative transcriptional regulator
MFMAQILQNKKLATRFQILAEIAASQPNVQQKLIAQKTNITPQAVSDYVAQLVKEGFIVSHGKSRYSITKEGVDWVLKMVREIKEYSSFVERAITNICVCTAVAERELSQGQIVGLKMRDGKLWASEATEGGARGMTTSCAAVGEDVGVSDIEGIVELIIGRITIAEVPDISRGGSARVDLSKLESLVSRGEWVGAIGLEALSALKKIGTEPRYFYGVEEAAVEAAFSGLSPFLVCTVDRIPGLIQRLQNENVEYHIVDLTTSET